MGTLEFTIPDEVEEQFHQLAAMRFGRGQESIEKAGEEAILMWIAEQNTGEISSSQNPLLTKRGHLNHVDMESVELQESIGELLMAQHRRKRDDSR